MKPSEDERRRFARSSWGADIVVEVAGVALQTARVIDVSLGGAFVELAPGVLPPALGTRARFVIRHSGAEVAQTARVVRVRWGGRERGTQIPAAVAFAFDDSAAATAHLAALLSR